MTVYRSAALHYLLVASMMVVLAGLSLSFANRAVAEEQMELPPAGHISLHGTIVNSSGDPQPGTRVLLRAASTPSLVGLIDYADVIAETTSDAAGRFAFDRARVPASMTRVVEQLDNHQRGADVIALADGYGISWAPLYSMESAEAIQVTLETAATLEGVVSDGDSGPLPDAKVTVLGISRYVVSVDGRLQSPDELRLYSSSLRPNTTTSAEGKFRIAQLPTDCHIHLHVVHPDHQAKYVIAAASDGSLAKTLNYTHPTGLREFEIHTNPIELKLATGLRLRVRVMDGEPVREGRIAVTMRSREWKTSMGTDGTATVTVAEPGDYHVTYLPADSNTGFGMSQKVSVTGARAAAQELAMRLPQRQWLEGRVVGQGTETGLGGVTVVWSLGRGGNEDNAVSFFARTMTWPDGRFRLPTVRGSGHVSLDGEVADFFIASYRTVPRDELEEHRVGVDEDADPLRIEVPRGLVVRGSVRDADGHEVTKAAVRAESLGRYGPRVRETISDDKGRFEIAGLNPRESYDISTVVRGGIALQTIHGDDQHPIATAREESVELTLGPTVMLRGRVLLDDRPLAKVRLQLLRGRPVGENRTTYRPVALATTGDDGQYELPGLRPGDRYQIVIDPPFPAVDPTWTHQSPYLKTLATDTKDEVVLPDVHLSRMSQTLAGMVVDPDGNPVAGATVSARLKNGRSLSRPRSGPPPWIETGEDGRFRLTQLPDQPLELMAYIRPKGPDRRIRFPATVECELNQQDIRIVLDPSLLEDE